MTLTDSPELTPAFLEALQLLDSDEPCIFLTGKAGTGKSTLLQYFRTHTRKTVAVVAPTGVAAMNVQGETIHRFFQLKTGAGGAVQVKKSRRTIYRQLDAVVIDEISMVRADMLDTIDRFLRVNGKHEDLPFGGIQMIFIGDLYQLPPIVASDADQRLIRDQYRSPYFFSAHVLRLVPMAVVELDRVHRQDDPGFIRLLNTVRTNRMRRDDLDALNERYDPHFLPDPHKPCITLCTTNAQARAINIQNIDRLAPRARVYDAVVKGTFDERMLPTDASLRLKKGVQVMFVKNDHGRRWVNGTLGTIKALHDDRLEVEIFGRFGRFVEDVEPVDFEMYSYTYDAGTGRVDNQVVGTCTQFPLVPAYAITIHKSQGKTFDHVIVDLGRGAFAHGQTYVALSRCTARSGLVLNRPLRTHDIRVDRHVQQFMEDMGLDEQPPHLAEPSWPYS